jgi:hypothetical protein
VVLQAPDVYHSWLTEGVNLKAIKRALGPLGGDMTGTCSSSGSRVVDLCNVLAYSAEVRSHRKPDTHTESGISKFLPSREAAEASIGG